MNDVIKVHCPVCDKTFTVSTSYIGKKAKCSCSNVFTIESTDSGTSDTNRDLATHSATDVQDTENTYNNRTLILVAAIVFPLGLGIGYLLCNLRENRPHTDDTSMQPVSPSSPIIPEIKIVTQPRKPTSDSVKQKMILPGLSREPIPVPTAEDYPSMEKVDLFPHRYVETKLVFTGCKVNQELNTCNASNKVGLFMIPVTSKGGKYMGSYPSDDGITFAVQEKMAENLSNDIQGGYAWPNCTISCVIVNIGDNYYAVIDGIDIYNLGGTVGRKYR
ncbi:MAG: hypothetical protein IH624_16365 [Phycisphaerae bacterium]|nr:hypothetical protein [Phycisphaerae bacterium]